MVCKEEDCVGSYKITALPFSSPRGEYQQVGSYSYPQLQHPKTSWTIFAFNDGTQQEYLPLTC